MKKYFYVFLLILAAVLTGAGCSDEEEEYLEDEIVATALEETRYGSITPAYKYGTVVKTDGDMYEDAYCVNKDDNPDAFNLYKADCLEAGFTELNTVTKEDNTFVTLQKDEVMLQIIDMPAFDEMDIIVFPEERYCDGNRVANRFSQNSEASFIMIGQSSGKYAMCFLYRLSDGRFIVIDGGYADSTAADWLYNEMLRQTPEGEAIEIAAWILTHSHDDHCGAYLTFARKYYKEVQLDMTVYNFGLDGQYEEADQNYTIYKKVVEIADSKLFDNHRAVTAHAGDYYDFGDLQIDFLYSAEMMLDHSFGNYNAASLVTRVNFAGQSVIYLADTNTFSNEVISGIYTARTLKSDVLQVAHHGYYTNADIKNLYETIAPTYVLWPSSEENYTRDEVQKLEANRWLLDNIPDENIYVCFDRVYRFDLPITAGGYEIVDESADIVRPAA